MTMTSYLIGINQNRDAAGQITRIIPYDELEGYYIHQIVNRIVHKISDWWQQDVAIFMLLVNDKGRRYMHAEEFQIVESQGIWCVKPSVYDVRSFHRMKHLAEDTLGLSNLLGWLQPKHLNFIYDKLKASRDTI